MVENEQLTPAERRREKQRLNIIRAADELYRANGAENGGFENTTVEAIAENSDISLRTFFRYFESKADVIYIDVPKAISYMEEAIQRRLKTAPLTTAIFNARLDQFELFVATRLGRERMLRAIRAPQFKDRLVILRNQTRNAIISSILPHLDGDEAIRMRHAKILATLYTEFFADALDLWGQDQSFDIAGYVKSCMEDLPKIVARIETERTSA
ncbi:MAG: TetR family transcriptional regulator [Sphingomonadales bacterium]|nr:TetR family transcriptional regulator [Sphingomonadaceae bacterium]MBS3932531.1 TetR family transcriptional regulator [Sphingomonadales bacterium]